MWSDPRGEFIPLLAGFLIGFGLDAGAQYLTNGFQLGCIDWWSAASSGALGAVGGGLGSGIGKGIGKGIGALGRGGAGESSVTTIHVTKSGVALPGGPKYAIPSRYVQNPKRPGSYGEIVNGRFTERLRIDAATPKGKNGPAYSHYHLNGGREHLSPRPGANDPGFGP